MVVKKVTLKIEVEVFDFESCRSLIIKMLENMEKEIKHGKLIANDSDTISWNTLEEEKEI